MVINKEKVMRKYQNGKIILNELWK